VPGNGIDTFHSVQGPIVNACDHDNKLIGSLKCEEFLAYSNDYLFPTNESSTERARHCYRYHKN